MKNKITLSVSLKKHLPIAIEHHKKGELDKAGYVYRSLYKKYPKNTDLLHFYGRLLFETDNHEKGIALVEKAVKNDPMYADALNNLGNMYSAQREYSKATIHYKKALKANPYFYDSIINLGANSRHHQEFNDAEFWYREAIATNPDKYPAYNNLAGVLRAARRYDEAFQILDAALANAGGDAEVEEGVYAQKSRLHYVLGQTKLAIDVYRTWLENYPDNAIAKHMIASLSGENSLEKSDGDYVKNLFNKFSISFDDVLEQLDYKAPELTRDIVQRHFGVADEKRAGGAVVLDAGCGTGLCGKFLKPLSSSLVGVDLSGGMLTRARSLNVYDSLIEAEIEGFLLENTDKFDLIVSADTFCYFGALESLFNVCADALLPKGMLVFTVENLTQNSNNGFNSGYFLNPHGRYSHSQDYVVDVLEAAGMRVIELDPAVALRKEAGKVVQGIIVLAEKRV